jgi:hypothetical protein
MVAFSASKTAWNSHRRARFRVFFALAGENLRIASLPNGEIWRRLRQIDSI